MDQFLSVKFKNRFCFAIVGFQSCMDDAQIGVIEAVLAESAALEALDEPFEIGAGEVKNRANVEGIAEHFGLLDVAGDTVKDKGVCIGVEMTEGLAAGDGLLPKADGRIVRHQLAATGVLDENAAKFVIYPEVAENVTAGAVIKVRDVGEDLALGALASTGCTEK